MIAFFEVGQLIEGLMRTVMGKVVQKRHEMESECLGICPDDLCMSVDWYDLIRSKNAAKIMYVGGYIF